MQIVKLRSSSMVRDSAPPTVGAHRHFEPTSSNSSRIPVHESKETSIEVMEEPLYRTKLTELTFNDGSVFEPAEINIFVGPNNVGKSRVLKDILAHLTQQHPQSVLVSAVKCALPTSIADLCEAYDIELRRQNNGNWAFSPLDPTLCSGVQFEVGGPISWHDWAERLLPSGNRTFWQTFGPALVTYLSTEHRLQLVKESISPQDAKQCKTLLQQLYIAGPGVELDISKVVERTFDNREVVLDFSTLHQLRFRVAKGIRPLPADPRDARPVLEPVPKLDEQGDGIRAFVGIATALLAVKRDVILIDEPESFLHPPQAFRIGEVLSQHCGEDKQLYVATHSVDVLRGIVSRRHQNVKIIRIDREGDSNSFRVLDPDRLRAIVTDPLLSSARVLDGIFYRGCVVVEADADARFYQAASRKMADGLDLHFVNADNKQTVPKVLCIYKELGVPCAGIVDIDVLNDRLEFDKHLNVIAPPGADTSPVQLAREKIGASLGDLDPGERLARLKHYLSDALELIAAPETDVAAGLSRRLKQVNSKLHEAIESGKPWREIKRSGQAALAPEIRPMFTDVWEFCARHGLFINPAGELESMLSDYGIDTTTDKRAWITQGLQVLAGLTVDESKQPWQLTKAVHAYLVSKPGETSTATD